MSSSYSVDINLNLVLEIRSQEEVLVSWVQELCTSGITKMCFLCENLLSHTHS